MNKEFDKIIEELELLEKMFIKGNSYNIAVVIRKAIEIVKQESEQYKDGWIPCSERLPDSDKNKYIVQKTNGFIDILGFTKDAYKLSRYDFVEYKGKKKQLFYDYDSEYGYIEWECEAWQPLPDVYKGE